MGKPDSGPRGPFLQKEEGEATRGEDNFDSCKVSRTFISSVSGGHLLHTERGLMGMASAMVQKGDAICVLDETGHLGYTAQETRKFSII